MYNCYTCVHTVVRPNRRKRSRDTYAPESQSTARGLRCTCTCVLYRTRSCRSPVQRFVLSSYPCTAQLHKNEYWYCFSNTYSLNRFVILGTTIHGIVTVMQACLVMFQLRPIANILYKSAGKQVEWGTSLTTEQFQPIVSRIVLSRWSNFLLDGAVSCMGHGFCQIGVTYPWYIIFKVVITVRLT